MWLVQNERREYIIWRNGDWTWTDDRSAAYVFKFRPYAYHIAREYDAFVVEV